MIRGIYTGASGMIAQMHNLDAISNNLANVDLTGYKKDTPVHKAFPELLLRRMNDDGVFTIPPGSVDQAPVIGTLGSGVEYNESYTVFSQGALKQTENPFDLALEGKGFFTVDTPQGERFTRNGSFHVSPEGILVNKQGLPVMGENGIIRLKKNNFVVDQEGRIWQNSTFADDPERLVSLEENEWENIELVDRLKLVDFPRDRYLKKQGDSLWVNDRFSGDPVAAGVDDGLQVRQGFLEGSNVNPVREMVRMIEVNRAYEANQKTIQAHDQMSDRLINQAVRV
ncbi:flagellar basal-body rod protein FlgF [Marispirochaeta aestuarii]|uniref:Flagellar basal-body rod protein FlgF n=1 Tax=Marispirochaeta aestuarii TaxID=1963862 RepID=A0A1Y1RUV7_9SPIO|nr:flagellar basal-body rod protein FlgF [Marispirochaeta aestuarii]ORC32868.1 flagellar basal-body rod protein FlgF [Marispirochaeta aestuarii]